MVAISALIAIFPAFLAATQAFPASPRSPVVLAHMNGAEARALFKKGQLGARDPSLCSQITIDQLNQMTDALNDATAYATKAWGGGWDSIKVNPSDNSGSPAQVCYPDPMQFTATWSSNPTCSKSSAKFTGHIQQGSNAAQVAIQQGSSVSAATTVESSTTIGSATEFKAGIKVGIPDVGDGEFSVSETVSVDLKNTKGSTTTATSDARTTVQDTVTCTGPANVEVDVDLQTCTAQGNVNFPVTLGGWVWFYYGSRRNGHYEWAVNLDDASISPLAHRQQTMSLSVNANTQSYGKFYGNCS